MIGELEKRVSRWRKIWGRKKWFQAFHVCKIICKLTKGKLQDWGCARVERYGNLDKTHKKHLFVAAVVESVWCGCKVNGLEIARWSNIDFTSSRSPWDSQKVTARPCMRTPHCSPTAQLVHSDLWGEGSEVTKSPAPMKMQRSEAEQRPVHLPDAGVQLTQEVGVKVVTQHGVLGVELH